MHPRGVDRLCPPQTPLERRRRRWLVRDRPCRRFLVRAGHGGLVPGAIQPEFHLGRGQQCRRQMLGVVLVERRHLPPAALAGRVAGGQAEQAWRPLGESFESLADSRRFRQTKLQPRLSDLPLNPPRRERSHHEDGQHRRLDPAPRRPDRAPGFPAEQRRRESAAHRRAHHAFGGAALNVAGCTAHASAARIVRRGDGGTAHVSSRAQNTNWTHSPSISVIVERTPGRIGSLSNVARHASNSASRRAATSGCSAARLFNSPRSASRS